MRKSKVDYNRFSGFTETSANMGELWHFALARGRVYLTITPINYDTHQLLCSPMSTSNYDAHQLLRSLMSTSNYDAHQLLRSLMSTSNYDAYQL